jgi:hypothetical protein
MKMNGKPRLVAGLTVLLLSIVSARLVVLIRGELRRVAGAEHYAHSVFNNGDLYGVGANGIVGRQTPAHKYRLLFVVHKSSLSREVEYWNAARKAVGPLDVEWWGVCDSGDACDAVQQSAEFSIVGFMPAYQMRIMANADAGSRALLYEGNSVRGQIEAVLDPVRVAEGIARLVQQGQ